MSLQVVGATAGYGGTEILRDVTITVPHGRVACLLGPNGAGKTTLLRTCSGLLTPSRGQVLLDGVDVTAASTTRRCRAGLCHVPEGRAIFPSLTVAENLRLLGGDVDDPVGRAEDAFPVLGTKLGQVAGTMSGGEQQMLALARAYLSDPRYVLLDEVSMGLAPLIVDDIFAFLRRLAERGAGLLIVEQYVSRALELADIAYVLDKGRIAFCGEPAELDADALARAYLGDVPT